MRVPGALSAMLLAAAVITGCGSEQEAEKAEGVIPEHQLKALEKAENVENLLEDAEKARRAATDD